MSTSEEIHLLCLGLSLAVRLDPRALRSPLGTTSLEVDGVESAAAGTGDPGAEAEPEGQPAEASTVLCP